MGNFCGTHTKDNKCKDALTSSAIYRGDPGAKMHYKRIMISERDRQLEFIKSLMAREGLPLTPFAKKACIQHTTLKRFLDGKTRTLHPETIGKIAITYNANGYHSTPGPSFQADNKAAIYDAAYIAAEEARHRGLELDPKTQAEIMSELTPEAARGREVLKEKARKLFDKVTGTLPPDKNGKPV